MFEEKQKNVFMQIRVSQELRDTFQKLCKEQCINSSELVRQLIGKWIEKQISVDKKCD